MNTPSPICSAMRSAPADSHKQLCDVLVCLASMVNRPSSALSDKAKRIVVDMIDEISGDVENDQIEQQAEIAWTGREIPGFGDLRGQFDARAMYGVEA